VFEQIQFSLKEQEEQNKKELASLEERITNAIALAIVESHQSILDALQPDPNKSISYDDANDERSSSSISLGLDDA